MDYPSGADEWELARRALSGARSRVETVVTREDLLEFQNLLATVPVSDQVMGYAWMLVRASRPNSPEAPEFVERWVQWGAGPRGVVALVMAAKSRAILHGRHLAQLGDIQAVAPAVLRHRIAGNDVARQHAISSDTLVEMLIEAVPTDQQYDDPTEISG
jgi:MoxR-like ATPase